MTPAELLAAARDLHQRPAAATAGLWPRAAAFLARQALEAALARFWEASPTTSGLSHCPMRSQLACLPTYLGAQAARQVAYVWAALSGACHYHAYELAPTAPELTGWFAVVNQLIEVLSGVPGVAAGP